ncbi:MAG: hypothetical protein RL556_437, partial [Actinomycetota bacterium]
DLLTKFDGQPQITAKGATPVNEISVGNQADMLAWLGEDSYTYLNFNTKATKIVAASKLGTNSPAAVAGSDLWYFDASKESKIRTAVNPGVDSAALISSGGNSHAPTKVTVAWLAKKDQLASDIWLIGGGIVLIAAIILNIWAYYTMRKNRGPRRRTPKAPQGPKYRPKRARSQAAVRGRRSIRNFTAVAATGLVLASLSGCSISPVPSPTPSASESLNQNDPAVLNGPQIKKIVHDISAIAAASDKDKSEGNLSDRFTGPALKARVAHYKLQSHSRSVANLTSISDINIKFSLPASSHTWPRSAMVVTSSDDAKTLPQMLVLEQASPRENYKVWYAVDVLPGSKFPSVAAADVGAIEVDPASLFLKVQPSLIPAAYGDLIDQGDASSYFSKFSTSSDPFYQQVSKSQADTIAKLKKASVSVGHDLGDANVISLATSDSGALVALYMTDTYTIKPKKHSAVTVEGNEKLLYGGRGSTKGIRTVYGDMLLFYVPSVSGKGTIQTLGATQVLISVKGL